MRYNRRNLVHLLTFAFLSYLMISFQSVIWFKFFGNVPSPQPWLNLILYFVLYHPPLNAILFAYGIGLIISAFSVAPLGILWPTFLCICTVGYFARSRFFWPSTRYFIIASLCFSVLYQIVFYFISSNLFEKSHNFSLFSRMVEVLFTTLLAVPQYWFVRWLDNSLLGDNGTDRSHVDISGSNIE